MLCAMKELVSHSREERATDIQRYSSLLNEIPDELMDSVLMECMAKVSEDEVEAFIRNEMTVSEDDKARLIQTFRNIYLLSVSQQQTPPVNDQQTAAAYKRSKQE